MHESGEARVGAEGFPVVEGFTTDFPSAYSSHVDDAPISLCDSLVEPDEGTVLILQGAIGEGRYEHGKIILGFGP